MDDPLIEERMDYTPIRPKITNEMIERAANALHEHLCGCANSPDYCNSVYFAAAEDALCAAFAKKERT